MNTKYSEFSYKIYGIFALLILPLGALYLSFKDFRQPYAKNLFWFFCIFLGMIHIYNPEGGTTSDGSRYAAKIAAIHNSPPSWSAYTATFFNEGEKDLDIYEPIIAYIVGQMTSNARWLFIVFAIVFGFFYSRNIWFVLDKLNSGLSFPVLLLITYLLLICPIWSINGVRMWTALHVFLYGALPLIFDNNKSRLVWVLISPLFHFSFIILVLLLFAIKIIPKSITFLMVIYCITFSVNSLNLEVLNERIKGNVPALFESRVDSYVNEEYKEARVDQSRDLSTYLIFINTMTKYLIFALVLLFFLYYKEMVDKSALIENGFAYSLALLSFANVATLVPSGGRFNTIALMIFLSLLIIVIDGLTMSKIKRYLEMLIFAFIPLIMLELRKGTDYYGISLLFGNPISCWFFESNVPVIQLVKSII